MRAFLGLTRHRLIQSVQTSRLFRLAAAFKGPQSKPAHNSGYSNTRIMSAGASKSADTAEISFL